MKYYLFYETDEVMWTTIPGMSVVSNSAQHSFAVLPQSFDGTADHMSRTHEQNYCQNRIHPLHTCEIAVIMRLKQLFCYSVVLLVLLCVIKQWAYRTSHCLLQWSALHVNQKRSSLHSMGLPFSLLTLRIERSLTVCYHGIRYFTRTGRCESKVCRERSICIWCFLMF